MARLDLKLNVRVALSLYLLRVGDLVLIAHYTDAEIVGAKEIGTT